MSDVKKAMTLTEKTTKALNTQTQALVKAVKELEELTAMVPSLVDEIMLRQGELDSIEEKTNIAARQAKVELDLRVKENEDKVLESLMKARSYAVITTSELAILNSKLKTAEAFNQDEIAKAVAEVEAREAAKYEMQLTEVKSQHSVESATANANLAAANNKITFLEEQIKTLQDTIAAEREARVEEARARASQAAPSITVSK